MKTKSTTPTRVHRRAVHAAMVAALAEQKAAHAELGRATRAAKATIQHWRCPCCGELPRSWTQRAAPDAVAAYRAACTRVNAADDAAGAARGAYSAILEATRCPAVADDGIGLPGPGSRAVYVRGDGDDVLVMRWQGQRGADVPQRIWGVWKVWSTRGVDVDAIRAGFRASCADLEAEASELLGTNYGEALAESLSIQRRNGAHLGAVDGVYYAWGEVLVRGMSAREIAAALGFGGES